MEQMRSEWFAQLADAIEGAQQVAWQLGRSSDASSAARELYRRLEIARLELEALRGVGDRPPIPTDRDWLSKLGWSGALKDPAG